MPCPIAAEIGEVLALRPGRDGGGGSGGDGGRRCLPPPAYRWLHDVLDVAEAMHADRVEIILDEKVLGYCHLS